MMPSFELRLSPKAEEDLEGIWKFTPDRWSREQTDKYISALADAMSALAEGRAAGTDCEYILQGYFKFLTGRHAFFYRIRGECLDVIRILHQRMDVKSHF